MPATMLTALALAGAIGPFATDTYLPALPLITGEFGGPAGDRSPLGPDEPAQPADPRFGRDRARGRRLRTGPVHLGARDRPIQSVAPVLAPLIGGAVVPFGGWRGVFWLLAGLSVITATGIVAAVPESLHTDSRRTGGILSSLADMRVVATHGPFVARVSAFVFTFGVLFAYISASPFIY